MAAVHGVELKRQIGLYAATAITVGNIIGSGIFRSPHSVAQELPTLPLVLLAWVVGGVLSICGSLVLTELAVTYKVPVVMVTCAWVACLRGNVS